MQLTKGSKLGPYEIVSCIGAGGMGVVWKGRDTRLDRPVAIKVLPAEVADDARLKLRFEREARAISKLDHPNICRLFDVGPDYLVMEFLDGAPLSSRIARGPLPLDEVLRWGAEIADALHRAHREGIVHRDVKPGNVIITKGGAKLLDFGIAKGDDGSALKETGESSTTLTAEGATVGTVHYMSPEQIEGAPVDARSDIFSLGILLYEMVTGKRPFNATSANGVIGAILKDEPPRITELQPLVSPALEHVINRCLAKAPDSRWQSAADIAEQLRWIAGGGATGEVAAARRTTRLRTSLLWAALTLAVGSLITMALYFVRRDAPVNDGPIRFSVAVPGTERVPFTYGLVAASPDGRSIVFVASANGELQLFRRNLDGAEAVPIRGTTGATRPFFSPDGKWIAFFANHTLMKVPIEGGDPVAIAKATTQPCTGDWAEDGTIVYCQSWASGITRVSANATPSQQPEILTPPVPAITVYDRRPQVLPGSKAILYTIGTGDGLKIVGERFAERGRRIVIAEGSNARYVAPDRLLVQRDNVIYAIAFDPETLSTRGDPVALVEGVTSQEFSINAAGTLLAFVPSSTKGGGKLELLDRNGRTLPIDPASKTKDVGTPAWSPDGRRIACRSDGNIWVFDTATAIWRRLGRGLLPAWTSDGKRVMYGRAGAGSGMLWRSADGADDEEEVFPRPPIEFFWPHAVSPDGIHVLAGIHKIESSYDLYLGDLRTRELSPFAHTQWDDHTAAFSPDGKWVAYSTDETGRFEVYARPLEGQGRWQISTDGGDWPVWKTPDEVVYRNGTKIESVKVRTQPRFTSDPPKVLFDRPIDSFDLSPDGRFVVVTRVASSPETIEVIARPRLDTERPAKGKR